MMNMQSQSTFTSLSYKFHIILFSCIYFLLLLFVAVNADDCLIVTDDPLLLTKVTAIAIGCFLATGLIALFAWILLRPKHIGLTFLFFLAPPAVKKYSPRYSILVVITQVFTFVLAFFQRYIRYLWINSSTGGSR